MLRITADGDERAAAMNNRWSLVNPNTLPAAASGFSILTVRSDYKRIYSSDGRPRDMASRDVLKDKSTGCYYYRPSVATSGDSNKFLPLKINQTEGISSSRA